MHIKTCYLKIRVQIPVGILDTLRDGPVQESWIDVADFLAFVLAFQNGVRELVYFRAKEEEGKGIVAVANEEPA